MLYLNRLSVPGMDFWSFETSGKYNSIMAPSDDILTDVPGTVYLVDGIIISYLLWFHMC
jgi:hypothetical protein